MDTKELIIEKVKQNFSDAVEEISDERGDLAITVKSSAVLAFSKFLKENDELRFLMCKDVTAIDWATRKNRFTVVYHVYSFDLNFNLRIKSNLVSESPEIESVCPVWESANWYERETFDMYGIKFLHHPDLRRMYMPEGFEYHPLRKEFPVLGIPGSLPLPKKID